MGSSTHKMNMMKIF